MPNVHERIQVMSPHNICTLLFLLIVAISFAGAQDQVGARFTISMIDNGQAVEGPTSVTFLDRTEKREVAAQEGRFCVPTDMRDRPTLDLMFKTGSGQFYLPQVPTARFDGPWDIEFGPSTYARLSRMPHVKKRDRKRGCVVVVKRGEPEIGMAITPCVLPAGSKSK